VALGVVNHHRPRALTIRVVESIRWSGRGDSAPSAGDR
jgi:hypothetical protein